MRHSRIIAMVAIIVVLIFNVFAAAQDFQQISQEFMQKWQAANSARMAGEYEKAIELFEECLDEKFNQEFLASTKSSVYLALGFLYSTYLNQQEEAREYLEQYIEMVLATPGMDIPAMAQMNAANETMVASAYRMLGEYENMVEHLLKSIEHYEAYWAGDQDYKMSETDYHRSLSPNYYFLAVGYGYIGNGEEAALNFEKAAGLYEEMLDEEHYPDVELMLSYIYRELGDLKKCIEYYNTFMEKTEKEAAASGDEMRKTMAEITRFALAWYYYDDEQWKQSMTEVNRAITAAESINWTSDVWRGYQLKGRLYEKMQESDAAIDAYEKSIEVIESQRSGLSAGDDRASFVEIHMNVYYDIIRLLIHLGRADDALEYFERSKARSFLDMLGGRKLGVRSEEEKEILERQIELQKEISGLTLAISSQMKMAQPADSGDDASRLRDAQRKYSELVEKIKTMRPEFSSLATVNPPDFSEVVSSLDDNTAILEFFPMEEELHAWVIKNGGVEIRSTTTKRKKIAAQVKMLRSKITRGSLDDSYIKNAQKLYDILISPVSDLIVDAETLIIVPHGSLHYLPFNVLMDGDKYLIDKHVVVIAPSSSTLVYILDKGGEDGNRLLALGDPETSLPPLPAAREEVAAIRGNFSEPSVYTGADALESLLTGDTAKKADVVHIASHGIFDPRKPMFSALALSADKSHGTDGFLQVHEIFGLDLQAAELVTLSACETGLAAISGGDDLVGLSRAFIFAGTPRVIVSLWSVNDFSTAELMKTLYGEMRDTGTAAALRKAQLEIKNNADFDHPFFWAPFQIIGDWR